MNDDGSGVEQLTYNQSHDLDPAPYWPMARSYSVAGTMRLTTMK